MSAEPNPSAPKGAVAWALHVVTIVAVSAITGAGLQMNSLTGRVAGLESRTGALERQFERIESKIDGVSAGVRRVETKVVGRKDHD